MAKLRNPAALTEQAPDTFKANFDTSKGTFVIEVHGDWAPLGADRFYNLVKNGFYDDVRFFRVIDGFMAQFGIHGNPGRCRRRGAARASRTIRSSRATSAASSSSRTAGPNTRTTQLFINFGDNAEPRQAGLRAVRRGRAGMDVVDKLYNGYGEARRRGKGPDQGTTPGRGQRVPDQGVPEARLHQDGDDRRQ